MISRQYHHPNPSSTKYTQGWVFKHFISAEPFRYEDLAFGHASHPIRETQMNPYEVNSDPIIYALKSSTVYADAAAWALAPRVLVGLSALTALWLARMAEARATASLRRSGR
jgi:hypothetical protein